VNNDGTYIPNQVIIGAGINRPVIYNWGVLSINNNNVKSGLFVIHANDMDGLSDIQSVNMATPDNATGYQLADIGTGLFYDIISGDGKFEKMIPGELLTGIYTASVSDQLNNEKQSRNLSFSYIDSPVITAPAANSTIGDRSPLLTWDAVTGAKSYDVVIKNNSITIYEARGITGIVHQIPSSFRLPDAVYTMYVIAYKDYDTYNGSIGIGSTVFTVQNASGINLDIGEINKVYYTSSGNVNSFDISSGISKTLTEGKIIDLSSDGQIILYLKNGALYRMRSNGTGQFKIAERYSEEIKYAKLSPDNNTIAYGAIKIAADDSYTTCSLYSIKSNGSGEVKLYNQNILTTMMTEYPYLCCFTNDGTTIYGINRESIFSIKVDGTDYKYVYTTKSRVEFFDLTPDEKSILFNSNTVISSDGLKSWQIHLPAPGYIWNRCFSMDGRFIYFLCVQNGSKGIGTLSVTDFENINNKIVYSYEDEWYNNRNRVVNLFRGFDNSIYMIANNCVYPYKGIKLQKINLSTGSVKIILPSGSIPDWEYNEKQLVFIH
jgi:hypothetical protein